MAQVLGKIAFYQALTADERRKLVEALKEEIHEEGHAIVTEGACGRCAVGFGASGGCAAGSGAGTAARASRPLT